MPSLPLVSETLPGCTPAPVPTQISCGMTVLDGQRMVVVQTSSPTGVHMSFLPPDMAREVARHLESAARLADGGDGVTMTIGRRKD
jgi:hypothetical protein